MMNKTAIALGLAMASGMGMAQIQTTGSAANPQSRGNAQAGLNAEFDTLDRNGDGVLSRSEASANETVAKLYDSLDTSETIEDRVRETSVNGITRAQFQAGMQALHSGSGTVGPAVSGGETYILMRDGTRKPKQGAENATRHMGGQGREAVRGVVHDESNAASRGRAGAPVQRERGQPERTPDRARSATGEARGEADFQRERAREEMKRLRDRTHESTSQGYGEVRSNGAARKGEPASERSRVGADADVEAGAGVNTR